MVDARYDVTRGPKRWVRAARNAEKNPTHKSAKLYVDRLGAATTIEILALNGELGIPADQPFQSMRGTRDWNAPGNPVRDWKREYAMCSVRCTVLQSTVDYSITDIPQLIKLLKGEGFSKTHSYQRMNRETNELEPYTYVSEVKSNLQPLDTSTITRSIRCMVCAASITPQGVKAVKLPELAAVPEVAKPQVVHMPCMLEHVERTLYAVATRGNAIESLDSVYLVNLTETEKKILEQVPDKRSLARELGTPVSLAVAMANA